VQERTAELAEVYRNLLDSINYAQRIQRAILPKRSDFTQYLPESFVFFQPKAIVSGDFYYLNHSKGVTVLSSVDCTGHGVPGAFMSMMGHNLMNQAIKDLRVPLPHQLLFQLDTRLQTTLRQDAQTKGDDLVADGMDVCVVVIQHEERELLFSGAHRPILYARNGEIHSIPGNRIPVGDPRIQDKVFDVHNLRIEPGDTFYLFTDGYVDQFGGERNRKYTPRRFREFLQTICQLPLAEQGRAVEAEFLSWKGNRDQTDDVCVIGFRPVP
jgi:serine phosphatase RsbU (regulator of sigma subunit)